MGGRGIIDLIIEIYVNSSPKQFGDGKENRADNLMKIWCHCVMAKAVVIDKGVEISNIRLMKRGFRCISRLS